MDTVTRCKGITAEKKRCKKRISEGDYCWLHYIVPEEPILLEIGKCCYCQNDCNPASQACGSCARKITMRSLGW